MGNDIRDSTGTNEGHSSLKLSVYSTFISKLDKTSPNVYVCDHGQFEMLKSYQRFQAYMHFHELASFAVS